MIGKIDFTTRPFLQQLSKFEITEVTYFWVVSLCFYKFSTLNILLFLYRQSSCITSRNKKCHFRLDFNIILLFYNNIFLFRRLCNTNPRLFGHHSMITVLVLIINYRSKLRLLRLYNFHIISAFTILSVFSRYDLIKTFWSFSSCERITVV